jgi:hypothetical protein
VLVVLELVVLVVLVVLIAPAVGTFALRRGRVRGPEKRATAAAGRAMWNLCWTCKTLDSNTKAVAVRA